MGNKLKLNLSIHYCKQVCVTESQNYTTTQANEINVCAQCTNDKGKNSSHVKFQDKIKIQPNLFQTVLIALQCLIT